MGGVFASSAKSGPLEQHQHVSCPFCRVRRISPLSFSRDLTYRDLLNWRCCHLLRLKRLAVTNPKNLKQLEAFAFFFVTEKEQDLFSGAFDSLVERATDRLKAISFFSDLNAVFSRQSQKISFSALLNTFSAQLRLLVAQSVLFHNPNPAFQLPSFDFLLRESASRSQPPIHIVGSIAPPSLFDGGT